MSMDNVSFDTILHGGLVLDPATGRNGMFDIGVTGGRVAAIKSDLSKAKASEKIDVSGKLVTAGMIDTHAHIYQHVTGKFGLEPDLVGVRSAVTTLVDQGGPSCMTIGGFKNFLAKKSDSRMLCYMSAISWADLKDILSRTPFSQRNEHRSQRARGARNRAMVRGIKGHAEIGGASRWGLEVLKMAKEIARQAELPLYIHLGQMWPSVEEGDVPSADELIRAPCRSWIRVTCSRIPSRVIPVVSFRWRRVRFIRSSSRRLPATFLSMSGMAALQLRNGQARARRGCPALHARRRPARL